MYDFWHDTTNVAPAQQSGMGEFTHDNEFRFIRLEEIFLTTVTSISVIPNSYTLQQGETLQLSATVEGQNDPPQTVTWTIEGNVTQGTTISPTGLLTLDPQQCLETLTVKATSTFAPEIFGISTIIVTDTFVSPHTGVPSVTNLIIAMFALFAASIALWGFALRRKV